MIHTAQKIWQLPLLLLALWLGGCAMQYDPDEFLRPQYPEGDLNLVLNIHTGDRTLKATRAETQYDNNDGVDFEPTTIDRELINTLRVIIVKDNPEGNDTIVHNEYLDLRTAPTDYVNGLKYSVFYDTQYNVYLIGNEEGLPIASLPQGQSSWKTYLDSYAKYQNYSAKTPLEDITISATNAGAPIIAAGNTNPVPMTEIFPVKTITKQEAEAQDKPDSEGIIQNETFFLTRAASKFSFYFFRGEEFTDASQETRTIDKIKITGLGKSEYLFPNNTIYHPAKDEERETTNRRDIKEFRLPSDSYHAEDHVFNLTTQLEVKNLPVKTSGFNSNYPLAGLTAEEIAACTYEPQLYFPESKGKDYNGTDTRGQDYTFECTIAYDGGDFLEPVKLPNLPHALPRNTHVVVIVTIHDNFMTATVDVIPFKAVDLFPDYGLEREQLTGYVIGKDAEGRECWFDKNYYQSGTGYPGPNDAKPLYLGPSIEEGRSGNPGDPVTINGKEYMLVYSDYERTAANLDHFFEVFIAKSGNTFVTDENGRYTVTATPVKHLLTIEGITGFEPRTASAGMDFWISDMKQRVGLENNKVLSPALMFIDRTEDAKDNAGNYPEYQVYYKDYDLSFGHTVNVWDYTEYKNVFGEDHIPGYYPKYWFDVLGNQYAMIPGPSLVEYPAYPKLPEHPGKAPEKPEGSKPARPVKPTPPTSTYPSYPLVSDFIDLPDGFDNWTDAQKNEWYGAHWWGTEAEKKYIAAQAEYNDKVAKYDEEWAKYNNDLTQYNNDLAAYDEYIKAMAKWNNYQTALNKYNIAVEEFNNTVAKWRSDVVAWQNNVKNEWNTKLAEWLTKVNQDKETKLGEWVKYLKD